MENFFKPELHLPEIIIFLGSLLCIIFGAFSRNRKYNRVYILSIVTLLISICFILFSNNIFEKPNSIFVNTSFTNIVKIFVISLSIGILYVSHGYIHITVRVLCSGRDFLTCQ